MVGPSFDDIERVPVKSGADGAGNTRSGRHPENGWLMCRGIVSSGGTSIRQDWSMMSATAAAQSPTYTVGSKPKICVTTLFLTSKGGPALITFDTDTKIVAAAVLNGCETGYHMDSRDHMAFRLPVTRARRNAALGVGGGDEVFRVPSQLR